MTRRRQVMVPPDDLPTRIRRLLHALHERTRYRLGLPGPDAGKVDLAPAFRHPIDSDLRSLLTSRYRELFPDAVATELAEARRLTAHRFTLLGHTVDHGEQIAWCRDPVSGREWSRDFSPDIPYRGPMRLGDIKFPWELNKHQYFFTLGKAAWLTDDPAPAVEIVRQIDHWLDDNPYHRGINWIGALEAGARAVSWIMAYPFYADQCNASFRRRLAASLAQHMIFVERHLSMGRFTNTHLIGEAAALVAGGLFLQCRRSRRWLEMGLALLEEEMERQVTPDGVHAERSVAYHRFFLDHYYLVSGLLAANGRALSAATLLGMERMTDFLIDILCPDGSAPAFGDGDDARGLWFRADCPGDYRSLLALAAVLFWRGDFKAAAGGLTEDVLWLLGTEGVNKFLALPTRPPDHTSAAYPEGGYYVMRGGWCGADPVLVFDCGPLGHGSAGHGHADALSFQLYAGGYPFLVDSGTFSYNIDYGWRDAFRSTRAHNTVVVDGQDQSVTGDRMSWRSIAGTRPSRWVTTHWFDLADGEHDGYRRLPDPVMHRRVVVFLKPSTWWIWDRLNGRGSHGLEALLHLRPDCEAEAQEDGILLTSPRGAKLRVQTIRGRREIMVPEVLAGTDAERGAWFSAGYGVRVPARTLSVRSRFLGDAGLITCLSVPDMTGMMGAEIDGALWITVHGKGGIEDTVFYRPNADRTLTIKDIQFHGDLLFRREAEGVPPIVWAGGFRELLLEGLVHVRSTVSVDSLVLEGNRCDIMLPPEHVSNLHVEARTGLRVTVNR